ncbi:MAG: hypothetical protein CFE21_09405 [Bacteroidetes bacterium B1(2017)]|nr:MAG: hypothetical protein CFE21_09405 [Bacteroidetes bacterium B1(2017)]
MKLQNKNILPRRKLLTSKSVFALSILVIVVTIVCIWLLGIEQERSLFENSILSTSILSLSFFLFISIGLYKGIKLKDDIGNLTNKITLSNIPDLSSAASNADFIAVGEGIGGILLSIVLWVLVTLLVGLFFWLFGAIVWTSSILFMAMLYWLFFRALRLVFKNSNKCKGKLSASILYGLAYTLLYTSWIYGIFMLAHYLIN